MEVDSEVTTLPQALRARFDHEELIVRRGRRTGVAIVAAVHSSGRGPALGPARIWGYETVDSAIADALALSRHATEEALATGLPRGGGAAVVALEGLQAFGEWERTALLHDLGEVVESLEGRLTVRRDVGLTEEDIVTLSGPTAYLAGRSRWAGGNGDPAPMTALGIEATLRAAVEHRIGPVGMARVHATVIGLGAVGTALAERLSSLGTRVTVSDIDPFKQEFADQIGAEWVDADYAAFTPCDALLPCAPGLALAAGELERLVAPVICGAAADALATPELASRLAELSILYVPPALSAAGAAIAADRELGGADRTQAMRDVAALEDLAASLFTDAAQNGYSPSELLAERFLSGPAARAIHAEPLTPLPSP